MITSSPNYVPESLVGRTLGKYRIMEIIGRGGMGVVFKVWDTLEDRVKAIKMVPPEVASSPLAFEDLKREISIASGIIHPNVVKVLSLEAQDGQYFIVMEYIAGESLEKKIADKDDRKLPEEEVVRLIKEAAKGVREAHARNIIHRDLKPRNIMETAEGQVKILDFGISHTISRSMTELTGKDITGTWPYMAPEQISNRFGRETQQVDIWALGVTMYQLLSGEVPFRNREQIIDIKEQALPLSDISKKSSRVVMKCLERDRKKRYGDIDEFLKDLNEIKVTPLAKTDEMGTGSKKDWKRFFEWPRVSGAVLVILSLLFLFYALNLNRSFLPDSNDLSPGSAENKNITNNISQTRQIYESHIKKAEEAEEKSEYRTALNHLREALNINASRRVKDRIKEISARSQAQQIINDSQAITRFIKGPGPKKEKIKQCRDFLQKYKNLTPYFNPEKDADILSSILQIQNYLEKLLVNKILPSELSDEMINKYRQRIRRIEISGLPLGVRALGQVSFKLVITEKGKILVQKLDDSGLKVIGQDQIVEIKMMMIKKLNNILLFPPRDKNGNVAKVLDWEVTFKVGTFRDKIILLYEVNHA